MKSTLTNTQENNNLRQEEYIAKILTMIETLYDNANTTSYKPTKKEKQTFNHIQNIINGMSNWF